jgi:hypothetical protein
MKIICLVAAVLLTNEVAFAAKTNAIPEKTPKSLFLIKKTKIGASVGEPQFYPAEAQLRTIINDQALHNIKKYE